MLSKRMAKFKYCWDKSKKDFTQEMESTITMPGLESFWFKNNLMEDTDG